MICCVAFDSSQNHIPALTIDICHSGTAAVAVLNVPCWSLLRRVPLQPLDAIENAAESVSYNLEYGADSL
jgi:hypothetical protein